MAFWAFNEQVLRRIKAMSSVSAVVFWFSWFIVWTYYANREGSALHAGGQYVYPLNTHGSIVYITSREHRLLQAMMMAGAAFALTAVLSYLAGNRR
jgi:hypothetical protein